MSSLLMRTCSGLLLIALLGYSFFFLPPVLFSLFLLSILGAILIFEWPRLGTTKLTPWYPIFPFLLLILANQTTSQRSLVLVIFVLAMSFDTGAYIFGSLFGKHKLAPRISPKKTWEGVLGGIALSLLTLMLPPLYMISLQSRLKALIIVLICDIAALIGDLFVSILKRKSGIKDCGAVLPGHGGFLDRFDSILFVAPTLLAIFAII
ncbi:TPA: phosphatidate cytidylyltransferase [Candidatus Dependentiae bacterium]|nr:MAG: hypothetical protein A2017_06975 [Lentisphaerae bacterium GWF2_44_16]HAU30203.1 phosphatidate cytidylyltransferase [Candidatus Dependentiae bacterium]